LKKERKGVKQRDRGRQDARRKGRPAARQILGLINRKTAEKGRKVRKADKLGSAAKKVSKKQWRKERRRPYRRGKTQERI